MFLTKIDFSLSQYPLLIGQYSQAEKTFKSILMEKWIYSDNSI